MRTVVLVGLLAVGACGDDGVHHLADAPPAPQDGAVDAPPDGPVSPVTVTVMSAKLAPEAGVKVYFQATDQGEIATTTTDATGVASAVMPHGGFVTVLDPFTTPANGFHDLHTWADVKSGDHLRLDEYQGGKVPPVAKITINAMTDLAGGPSSYSVYTQCGSGGFALAKRAGAVSAPLTTTVSLYPPCGPTVDVVVIDYDGTGTPINYLVQPSAPATDGSIVDLTTAGWQGTVPSTITVSGLPANTSYVSTELHGLGPSVGEIYLGNDQQSLVITNASASYQVSIVPPASIGPWEQTEIGTGGGSIANYHFLGRWGATPDASTTNYSQTVSMLPDFTVLGAFDQATETLAWTTAASANAPDYYLATIDDTNASFDWEWQIVGKYSGASLVFPKLPGDGAMFNPTAGDGATFQDLTLARSIGGYDIARPLLLDLYQQSYFRPEQAPISSATTAGSFEYVYAQPQGTKRAPHHSHQR